VLFCFIEMCFSAQLVYAVKLPSEAQDSKAFLFPPSVSFEKQEKKGVAISLHSFGVIGK
jgi:hypothetical protein